MDPALLAKIISNSPLIAMIIGLLAAIKILRAEWLDREKLWCSRLEASEKANDELQRENIIALKEQLKLNLDLMAEMKALREAVQAKGGA